MSVNQVNQTTGALSPIAGGTLYADAPVGSIQAYGGATAPFGWLLCQGQAISRTTYAELFGVIGTSYGSGDGSTTFNVPDLRGKVLAGYNSSETEFNALGKTGGEKTHTLTVNEMPAHSHVPKNSSSQNMTLIGDSSGNNPIPVYSSSTSYAKTGFAYLANAGGDGAHNNLQPYSTVSYIIKATTIALPSDFEDTVDEKFTAANATLKDSTPTQNSVKPITSGGVYSKLKDFVKIVTATGSLTLESSEQNNLNLTFTTPTGYTPIVATPQSAGSWAWGIVQIGTIDVTNQRVNVVVKSWLPASGTYNITANIICIRTM